MTSETDAKHFVMGDLNILTALLDASGQIIYVNPVAEELTGYTNTELIGLNINTLSGSPDPVTGADLLERARGNVTSISPMRRADGTIHMLEWRAHLLPHSTGDMILVTGFVSEELNKAQSNLALLDAFFQESSFGFAILDRHLRYVMLNQALADTNHRPIADHLGVPMQEIINSDDIGLYVERLKKLIETGEPVQDLRISGTATSAPGIGKVWGASWFRLQDKQNHVIGLCGIIFDITEREQTTLEAAQARSRFNLLSEANAVLGFSLDLQRTAKDFTDLVVARFCDLALVDVLAEVADGQPLPTAMMNGQLVQRIASSSKRCSAAARALTDVDNKRILRDANVFSAAIAAKGPQLIDNPTLSTFANAEKHAEHEQQLGLKSMIIAPLRTRNLTLGVVSFVRNDQRAPFSSEDVALAGELADRAALCIENAHLYRQEQHAALALQRSLLPRELPKLPEADVGYLYRPSSAGTQVGGDWCDVIPLPGRRVGLVIGDVMGHGITAAATMGRYRTAVQSLASVGLAPGVLLTRLNALSFEIGVEVIATCFYLVYDPAQHYATFACAGHPPPLFAPPHGTPVPLTPAAGPPLGTTRATAYTPTSITVAPGSTLLCYTDGVVESRTAPIEAGISRLARLLSKSAGTPQEACGYIMANIPQDNGDDAALLLAHFKDLQRSQL